MQDLKIHQFLLQISVWLCLSRDIIVTLMILSFTINEVTSHEIFTNHYVAACKLMLDYLLNACGQRAKFYSIITS